MGYSPHPTMNEQKSKSKQKRRRFSPENKVRILRLHLVEKVTLSEVCTTEDISPDRFYTWQKQFFEGGAAAFEPAPKPGQDPKERRIGELESELTRKVAVIGELAQELVEAKKPLGGS